MAGIDLHGVALGLETLDAGEVPAAAGGPVGHEPEQGSPEGADDDAAQDDCQPLGTDGEESEDQADEQSDSRPVIKELPTGCPQALFL